MVVRPSFLLEAQAAVLAHGRLVRHFVQLNIFDRVAQRAATSVADSSVPRDFDNGHRTDQLLGVAPMPSVAVLHSRKFRWNATRL